MYAAERQQRIMAEARQAGRVEVALLAESLGVTAETVRRDLTALERRGSLRRVHGGAIPVERLELEPTLAARSGRLADVKRRIAARVLDELPTGGTVLLDSGSTTQAVVQLLPPDLDLTVLTNSVSAAAALSTHPGITLYLLGGTGPRHHRCGGRRVGHQPPSRVSSSTSPSWAPTASPPPAG